MDERASVADIASAYDALFATPLTKLKEAALSAHLLPDTGDRYDMSNGMMPGRSLAWKLFLIPASPLTAALSNLPTFPLQTLRETRTQYVELMKHKFRAPDGNYDEGVEIPGLDTESLTSSPSGSNWSTNNPLSLDESSGWNDWFAAAELRKTIRQDVERTFPDITFFRDGRVQNLLTAILYLRASQFPSIGYRQGMHELLAPLFYAVSFDAIPASSSSLHSVDSVLLEVCDPTYIAADAYALFNVIMDNVGSWYEWQEPTPPPGHIILPANGNVEITPYVAPIVKLCETIQGGHIKGVDPALWAALKDTGIEPQMYGIRWLRLLFTREFNMLDAMLLWDGLFASDATLQLSQWICVAMLLRIRNELIPSDYSTQLSYLLRYPIATLSETLSSPPVLLLVQQALALQSLPTPATGASIVVQNRSLLGIPVEVPDPPAPRRRAARRNAGPGTDPKKRPVAPSMGSSAHIQKLGRDQFGIQIPELLSKGLSDVYSTVTEIRRNLPDIPTTYTRTSSSDIAFPYEHVTRTRALSDDGKKSPSLTVRPPWEPRTRFELEREIGDYQTLHKKLGSAVGWAVDTLLQSEGDTMKQKREAIESLAYIRDVLTRGVVSNVNELEEERLFGEEELVRRKEIDERRREEQERSLKARTDGVDKPQEAFDPLAGSTASIASSGDDFMKASSTSSSSDVSSRGSGPSSSLTLPSSGLAGGSRTRTYLSTRDSTPSSSLPRIPYAPQPTVSPKYSTSTFASSSSMGPPPPRTHKATSSSGLVTPAPKVIPPWESSASSFDSGGFSTGLQKPPPVSSGKGLGLGLNTTSPGRRRASDSQGSARKVTYQSDPLRG